MEIKIDMISESECIIRMVFYFFFVDVIVVIFFELFILFEIFVGVFLEVKDSVVEDFVRGLLSII